jgi:hypothetical protein
MFFSKAFTVGIEPPVVTIFCVVTKQIVTEVEKFQLQISTHDISTINGNTTG